MAVGRTPLLYTVQMGVKDSYGAQTVACWNRLLAESTVYGCGLVSLDGIATGYGLDGLGIEFRLRDRFSLPVHTSPVTHPASYTMDTGLCRG